MLKKKTLSNKQDDLILLKMDLQLFAEDDDEDDVDYSDEDDDSLDEDLDGDDDEDAEEDDAEQGDDESEDESESKEDKEDERKQKGKPSKKYEAIRKKAEEQAEKKLEKERAELQAQRIQLTERAVERKILDSITSEKVWEKADEEGITEAAARKMLEAEAKSLIESEKSKVRTHFQTIEKQKTELRQKPFFRELEPDIEKFMEANPNWDVSAAYKYLLGERYDELHTKKTKQDEKRDIANAHDRMRRRTVSGNSKSRGSTSGALSDFGRKAAIEMGLDPRDVAKHVAQRKKNFKI
jgi:phage-related protein